MKHKIIQIAVTSGDDENQPEIIALTEEGELFGRGLSQSWDRAWYQFPPIVNPKRIANDQQRAKAWN